MFARAIAASAFRLTPGLALCFGIAGLAVCVQLAEASLLGRPWLEPLAFALLLGAALRTFWSPSRAWRPGIAFSAKPILEVAVVLLGAAFDPRALSGAGFPLLSGIGATVGVAIAASYGLGRLFGVPRRLAILIACGNAICGNSAIAAVAPVIGAEADDVTASVAFTAALGVVVVLGLAPLAHALRLSERGFGVFAGLTVYAVPQVLAATAPAGRFAAQVGTLVKLVRVLMLGPVVIVLSLLRGKPAVGGALAQGSHAMARGRRPGLVPWFIIGFLAMSCADLVGWLPQPARTACSAAASGLTVVAMSALGLGVDIGAIGRCGKRAGVTVALSLALLAALSLLLIDGLGLG